MPTPVRIKVRTVGTSFACCADLVARNGRVVASTDVRPYDSRVAAWEDGKALAAKLGRKVLP